MSISIAPQFGVAQGRNVVERPTAQQGHNTHIVNTASHKCTRSKQACLSQMNKDRGINVSAVKSCYQYYQHAREPERPWACQSHVIPMTQQPVPYSLAKRLGVQRVVRLLQQKAVEGLQLTSRGPLRDFAAACTCASTPRFPARPPSAVGSCCEAFDTAVDHPLHLAQFCRSLGSQETRRG